MGEAAEALDDLLVSDGVVDQPFVAQGPDQGDGAVLPGQILAVLERQVQKQPLVGGERLRSKP